MTPTGSRRMIDVIPFMYSPALRPSSRRAAPAKNRIWSTIGGISSDSVSAIGFPVFSLSSAIRSAALASTASAIRYSARLRSLGVESFHSSKAAAAARHGGVDVGRGGQRRGGVGLTGGRVDDVRRLPVGRIELLAVDEVLDDAGHGVSRLLAWTPER